MGQLSVQFLCVSINLDLPTKFTFSCFFVRYKIFFSKIIFLFSFSSIPDRRLLLSPRSNRLLDFFRNIFFFCYFVFIVLVSIVHIIYIHICIYIYIILNYILLLVLWDLLAETCVFLNVTYLECLTINFLIDFSYSFVSIVFLRTGGGVILCQTFSHGK